MGNTAGNPDPETMKCAVLEGPRKPLIIEERPMPRPRYGQVLIKVEASSINPSDVAFTQGNYNFADNYPTRVGLEGSGTVVSSGGGFMARRLVGKKVAFVSAGEKHAGSWGQYHVVGAETCAALGNNEDMKKAACSFANPITSLIFLDMVLSGSHKCVVQTAACSALGKMNVRVFKEFGIRLINIVRREDQAEQLRAIGAEIILNSEDADFPSKLKEALKVLNATICFDAVGGDLANKIFDALPERSHFYLYGLLSSQHMKDVDVSNLMVHKVLSGFHISHWLAASSIKQKVILYYRFNKYRKTLLASDISESFPLSKVNEAISFYKKNMSKGKVVILPNAQE